MDLEYEVQSCLVDLGETAESVVSDTLSKEKFDCIMVGAGIRILPQHCQNTSLVQNYTLQIILKIKAQEEIGNTRDVANDNSSVWGTGISKVYFMICHACLWCASCIVPHILGKTATVTTTKEDSTSLTKCPSCAKGTIASIPIAENQK